MNIIFVSTILSTIIVVISNAIGNKLRTIIFQHNIIIPELLGFIVWIGILSVFGFIMLYFDVPSVNIFYVFFGISLVFLVFSISNIKWNYSIIESSFIFIFVIFLTILSLKYRLGEEMGDNTYLMNMVSMNSIRPFFNATDFDNGFFYGTTVIGVSKSYLTWYHFYSFLVFYAQRILRYLGVSYIPNSLIFVWTGNFVFYIFSSMITLNVIQQFKVRSKWIIAGIGMLTLYWGTVYYNLVLGHFGSNFVSIFVISLWMILTRVEKLSVRTVSVIVLNLYAVSAMGNVGLIAAAYTVFAYIIYEIISKKEDIFKWAPFLLLPIFHWIWILDGIIPVKWLIPFVVGLSILSWFIHYVKPIKDLISKYIYYILFFVLITWYGLAFLKSNDYWLLFFDFFAPKSNFDRLQDYFSFVNPLDSLRNIAVYIALSSLLLNKNTRKMGQMVLIVLIFFINPIVYPMLYPPLQWLYHRAYISIFNILIFMIGAWSLFNYLLSRSNKIKYVIMIFWMLLLVPSTHQQVTGYFHRIYIPGPDFNAFYKLDNDQIEVLEKLRQIVTIENYENARVISQIYGTTMYVPQVYHMYFNFTNRRMYDANLADENYSPLYRIFYTPVFDGDDGPRFAAPYSQTCALLIEHRVDFVIYKKELSAFDQEAKNWIPIHWYARGCADRVFENENYIMYRFFWNGRL